MAGLNKSAGDAARLVLVCNGDESSLVLETTAETKAAARSSGRGSPEPPPLVFICGQCKRVLGNSSGWVESDMGDQSVMLKDVSPFVIKDKEPTLSTAPEDHCCMIENLFCSGCSTRIGKIYRSTPKHLDYKRELFCLDIDAIESYAIGSTTVQEVAEKDEPITLELRSEVEAELNKAKAVLALLQNEISTLKSKKS